MNLRQMLAVNGKSCKKCLAAENGHEVYRQADLDTVNSEQIKDIPYEAKAYHQFSLRDRPI